MRRSLAGGDGLHAGDLESCATGFVASNANLPLAVRTYFRFHCEKSDMGSRGPSITGTIVLTIVLLLAVAIGLQVYERGGPGYSDDHEGLVKPIPEGGELWPYTSRVRDVGGRTLAINVLAVGQPEAVRRTIERVPRSNWTERPYPGGPENETAPILDEDSELVWIPARGAARYTFVRPPGEEGRWLAESYQLFDGRYLGTRDHVRAYVGPGGTWTAMQVHAEYWDWFRLRHTVTSTERPQERLDRQVLDDPRVGKVTQVHLRNGDAADSDGWATMLQLATLTGALAIAGVGGRNAFAILGRVRPRLGSLIGAILGLYLLIRLGGIGLEPILAGVSPKVIAAGFYPLLALGLPSVAYVLSRDLPPITAVEGAIVGLGSALVLEYVFLGFPELPLSLVLHRLAVVFALGSVAAAGATTATAVRRKRLALSAGVWVVALCLPLFGFV